MEEHLEQLHREEAIFLLRIAKHELELKEEEV
jgi:hypothetical protein